MQPMDSQDLSPKDNITWVNETRVFCAGENLKGHPGIYLYLKAGKAVCPYCSKTFQQATV